MRGQEPELSRLAVRRHRRSDQALRLSAPHAQSGRELPRPARFAGQLRRQRAADDAVPARGDRRADRARLRQGHRQADGGDPARPGGAAARLHGDLLRLYRPGADLHHRRHRPDGRSQAPAAHRLDPFRAGAGQRGPRLRQMGLPADLDRGRAGKLRARLFDHDHRAAGPGLHVLRRGAAGGAAGTPGGAAARRRRRHAGTDGARSARDRGDRRQAAQSRASDAARRICRPARRRVREHRGAGRAHRRGGMGRQQRAQLSQQASALPEHGQGVAAAHRPGRRPRRQRLGKAAHRAQQRQAHARADHAAVVRFRRDRLRRDQHQQVGDGLLPDAAVLDPGARRHRARHSGADPHLPEAHRRRHQAASAHQGDAASRSASGTTKSGRSGRKRRARTGTPRRSPSHGWRSRSGR